MWDSAAQDAFLTFSMLADGHERVRWPQASAAEAGRGETVVLRKKKKRHAMFGNNSCNGLADPSHVASGVELKKTQPTRSGSGLFVRCVFSPKEIQGAKAYLNDNLVSFSVLRRNSSQPQVRHGKRLKWKKNPTPPRNTADSLLFLPLYFIYSHIL